MECVQDSSIRLGREGRNMKAKAWLICLVVSLGLPLAAAAQARDGGQGHAAVPAVGGNQIRGDYVELRTADVYTGPCFANGEVRLTGHDAVLAWRIASGSWGNVPLDGLSIVAAVRANATLGDSYSPTIAAKSVLIVDERATQAQRAALIHFAQTQTRGLLDDVLAVEAAPIRFAVDEGGQHGFVTLEAGNLAKITTRALTSKDHLCGNEEVFYPPLAANLDHAMPAVAREGFYRGNHLGGTWKEAERRGAFVGSFAF